MLETEQEIKPNLHFSANDAGDKASEDIAALIWEAPWSWGGVSLLYAGRPAKHACTVHTAILSHSRRVCTELTCLVASEGRKNTWVSLRKFPKIYFWPKLLTDMSSAVLVEYLRWDLFSLKTSFSFCPSPPLCLWWYKPWRFMFKRCIDQALHQINPPKESSWGM